MYELHKNEQYFFDTPTLVHLASFLSKYNSIGVLCAPLLGKALADNKKTITLLDIDERFYNVPGFLHWDIYKPQRLPQKFDIIICDPLSSAFLYPSFLKQSGFYPIMTLNKSY